MPFTIYFATGTGSLVGNSGPAPLSVPFTVTTQGETTPTTYAWQFGDGGTSTSSSPTYVYSAPGIYSPILTITDNDGNVVSTTQTQNIYVS
jgi:PKD repeat protein